MQLLKTPLNNVRSINISIKIKRSATQATERICDVLQTEY